MARKKLGEMLIEAGVLSENTLLAALAEQRRWGGTLGKTLVEMKAIGEDDLVRVLSAQLGLQPVDLDQISAPQAVLQLISGELAQQWNLVPFAKQSRFLDVAMTDPTNLGIIDELRIRTQLNIRPYLTGPKMMERAIARFYQRGFGQVHRPELAITLDAGDVLEQVVDTSFQPPPPPPTSRDGIRPFPRGKASLTTPPGATAGTPAAPAVRDAEILALQTRLSQLEALVQRDEEVLRKLLALLIDKGVATREEILERIR